MEWDVEKLSNSKWTKKIMGIVLLLLVALLSFNKISVVTSSPETYASMIESLDEKRNTVTGLIATSTATSAAITVLPDDVGTPIAEKIADLSTYFLIVLGAIFLEKILLTVGGYVTFKCIVPILCFAAISAILIRKKTWRIFCYNLIVRMLLFGFVLCIVTPASIQISTVVENLHATSINESVEKVKESAESMDESDSDNESQKKEGFVSGLVSKVTDLAEGITSGVTQTLDAVQNYLNNLIEAFAIFMVTTCIIPIVVLIILILAVKWIFNSISLPKLQA